MKRYGVAMGVTIVKNFGLRKDELTYLRIHVLEDAIKTKQLHVYNGKGGQERDILFDTIPTALRDRKRHSQTG